MPETRSFRSFLLNYGPAPSSTVPVPAAAPATAPAPAPAPAPPPSVAASPPSGHPTFGPYTLPGKALKLYEEVRVYREANGGSISKAITGLSGCNKRKYYANLPIAELSILDAPRLLGCTPSSPPNVYPSGLPRAQVCRPPGQHPRTESKEGRCPRFRRSNVVVFFQYYLYCSVLQCNLSQYYYP